METPVRPARRLVLRAALKEVRGQPDRRARDLGSRLSGQVRPNRRKAAVGRFSTRSDARGSSPRCPLRWPPPPDQAAAPPPRTGSGRRSRRAASSAARSLRAPRSRPYVADAAVFWPRYCSFSAVWAKISEHESAALAARAAEADHAEGDRAGVRRGRGGDPAARPARSRRYCPSRWSRACSRHAPTRGSARSSSSVPGVLARGVRRRARLPKLVRGQHGRSDRLHPLQGVCETAQR